MADYIEKETAKEAILSWAVCINHPELLSKEDAMHCIDNLPAADVAEVVRCWECSHSQKYLDDELFCLCFEDVVPLYGYCYKGKRKEDEHEVN